MRRRTGVEVIAGVLLSGSDSDDVFQFYTLVSYVDWEKLATAFNEIGVPNIHVRNLNFDLAIDPLTRTGPLAVDVPAPGETITAVGNVFAWNSAPLDARAAQFALGPHGAVRVDHHSPTFAINPDATATITTSRPDGVIARAMGATSRRADGFFFEKGPGHHHTAGLID